MRPCFLTPSLSRITASSPGVPPVLYDGARGVGLVHCSRVLHPSHDARAPCLPALNRRMGTRQLVVSNRVCLSVAKKRIDDVCLQAYRKVVNAFVKEMKKKKMKH